MSFIGPPNLGDIGSGLGFAVGAGQSAIAPTPPTGTSGAGVPTGRAEAIASAASKYKVPIEILTGVYGVESAFGTNHNTSSAGAVGPFQFLPSTAKGFGYPLTNNPTPAQFQAQADAAAKYLSELFHQTGSWNAALQHYSGGGYGLAQVTAKAKQAPASLQGILNSSGFTNQTGVGQATTAAAGAAVDTATGVAAIANLLTSGQFWLRAGECIAGAILIALGLWALTSGGNGNPVTAAKKVARHV
jgi:soluble lytic murein transglycosylase-like protein